MEENVALDSEKQKQFMKSIKGIKKLIKDDKIKIKPDEKIKKTIKKQKTKKKKNKGLVYLSHIPHGFFEQQMTEYFKQFGKVTNARVIRSKRTGRSKGHAFVEFADTNVALIVTETMDNYLMGKRLLKAVYIPPEKQRIAFRKNWNIFKNPGSDSRTMMKKAYNADKSEVDDLKKAKKIMKNIAETKKKLSDLGIDYSFFTPVDIPEELLNIKKEEEHVASENIVKQKKVKKEKVHLVDSDVQVEEKSESKNTKKKNKEKVLTKLTKLDKKLKGEEQSSKTMKKAKNVVESVKQKPTLAMNIEKIKPLKDFISVKVDNEDSSDDSSYSFDSDEFDKLQENEEEFNSDFNNSSDGGSDVEENISESEEELPTKKAKLIKQIETKPKATEVIKQIQTKSKATGKSTSKGKQVTTRMSLRNNTDKPKNLEKSIKKQKIQIKKKK